MLHGRPNSNTIAQNTLLIQICIYCAIYMHKYTFQQFSIHKYICKLCTVTTGMSSPMRRVHLQAIYISMPSSNILGLQVLKLTVDVKPVTGLRCQSTIPCVNQKIWSSGSDPACLLLYTKANELSRRILGGNSNRTEIKNRNEYLHDASLTIQQWRFLEQKGTNKFNELFSTQHIHLTELPLNYTRRCRVQRLADTKP